MTHFSGTRRDILNETMKIKTKQNTFFFIFHFMKCPQQIPFEFTSNFCLFNFNRKSYMKKKFFMLKFVFKEIYFTKIIYNIVDNSKCGYNIFFFHNKKSCILRQGFASKLSLMILFIK